jgi:RNA polymerase sigma factor (sigma-70 family)
MLKSHVKIIESIVTAHTKRMSRFDRDDVRQVAYMGYLSAMASYESKFDKKLTSWIHTKVKYAILEHFGKVDRLKLCDKLFNVPDHRDAETLYLGLEETDTWLRLICRLKPTYKVILLKVFFEGVSQTRIAKEINQHPSRVKVLLDEALVELKKAYLKDAKKPYRACNFLSDYTHVFRV